MKAELLVGVKTKNLVVEDKKRLEEKLNTSLLSKILDGKHVEYREIEFEGDNVLDIIIGIRLPKEFDIIEKEEKYKTLLKTGLINCIHDYTTETELDYFELDVQ